MVFSKAEIRAFVLSALNAYVSPDVDLSDPKVDDLSLAKAGLGGGRVNAYRVWFINQNFLQRHNANDIRASEVKESTKIKALLSLIHKRLKAAGHTVQ